MSISGVLTELEGRLEKRRETRKTRRQPTGEMNLLNLASGMQKPRSTTIVAIRYKDGVVMAGDRLTIEGWGSVFSRTSVKLDDIQDNAVIGTCGLVALAQGIIEDLQFMCGVISGKIKRQISLEGKCNLLKEVVIANALEEQWLLYFGVSFGAIMGGFDLLSGPAIASFDTEGGVYRHEDFFTDGSGRRLAQSYIDHRYQYGMSFEKTVPLAVGAVLQAGKYETSVSHPLDPPPTVKVISENGIYTMPEKVVKECRDKIQEENKEFLGRLRKRGAR